MILCLTETVVCYILDNIKKKFNIVNFLKIGNVYLKIILNKKR